MICNNIKNSGSSSSSQIIRKHYDVFVSFRGKDTRNNFTDHLFGALQRKGIPTFRDDKKLRKGQSIEPELLQAIEGSQVLVVVFSKNYASSTWCLKELVKILNCFEASRKHVLPIFYDVDPSEVRKQSGKYEKAFAKHEKRFKDDLKKMEEVKRWREVLTHVANLSGWDVRDKPQYVEIEKIVEEIICILDHKFSRLPNNLVGMQSRIEELEKLLLLDSVDDVRVLGICGMGGLGKTTLAMLLYDRISHQYDACCFIDDVSKIYKDQGPIGAQRQILHQTLNEENLQAWNICNTTNLIRRRLQHVRALIVLDNVDHVGQLEKLAVNREWLGVGSRIILISRDEQILKAYEVDTIYRVPLLNWDNSIQLFCRKVFKCDDITKDYEELTYDILQYANGLPLAIEVLGSFLFGRDLSEWRSALARLKEYPSKDIMDVLRLSFDGLDETEKEIFLHIACFFNRYLESYVKKILNYCELHADVGISVLTAKSLISIENDGDTLHNRIKMHSLLQNLGIKIIQEEPIKWRRLWLDIHFHNVMLENKEENVEAVVLNKYIGEAKTLAAETLSKMSHLKLLIIRDIYFSGHVTCLSNELRFVKWIQYPFEYLPSNFQPNKLVELILRYSNIKQLWEGKKCLPNLKTLDLSYSEGLINIPDFGEVPNLERLNLEGCVKLVQVDPSIGLLRKLMFLNLKYCKNIVNIPNNILGLNSLKYLNLSGCSKMSYNLMDVDHLKKNETTLQSHRAPRGSGSINSSLLSWPSFSCLHELDISFCGLSQISNAIGSLYFLDILNLEGNNFVTLPSLKELSKLVYLNLQHCKQLKSLPKLPSPTNLSSRRKLVQDHLFSLDIDWELDRAGLYIFNCPKLGERERCSHMAFSWMMQVIKVNQESFDPFHEIDIVIPESEIPRWFYNQSVGDSIKIDPSHHMLDSNCIGIACCVVFVMPNNPPFEGARFLLIGFQHKGGVKYSFIDVHLVTKLVTEELDHMWLIYFTREKYFYMMDHINHKRHDLTFTMKSETFNLEVKTIGYRWVFKQDLDPLNLTMMHGGDSLAQKRKHLVIEDESQP